MPANLFANLLSPRFPSCAIGLEKSSASAVQLERSRGGFVIRRAATVSLPDDLIRPSFDEANISDASELAEALSDLLTSSGLLRQRKWSVSFPETATRTAILTLEGATGSRREQDEMLEWKTERSFGAPLSELRITRETLPLDSRNQKRYLTTAVRLSVLAEYEAVFAALGWQAGLVLPRHVGEQQWLRNAQPGDGLLLTGHDEGFIAVLLRQDRPFVMRSVFCEAADCDDELYRLLMFYRDRAGSNGGGGPDSSIDRLLVLGDLLDRKRVAEIARETLGTDLRPLNAADVGLLIPGEMSFDTMAAPAGLAKMAW